MSDPQKDTAGTQPDDSPADGTTAPANAKKPVAIDAAHAVGDNPLFRPGSDSSDS